MITKYRILGIVMFLAFNNLLFGQSENVIVKDPKTDKDIYVGAVTVEGLKHIDVWFDEEYNLYKPDSTAINYLKDHQKALPNLFIVLGTWCGDSKEHVPHFFKIADEINYPKEKIFMVAVDRDKKGGDFCLADFEVTLVPTFIFTKNSEEIGRIIEAPVISLEQDIVNIMTGKK